MQQNAQLQNAQLLQNVQCYKTSNVTKRPMQQKAQNKKRSNSEKNINPIPAGVLENQDTLGGVNLTPPLNFMFYVQIWQMIHH